ncbi:response regulator transcription factor [Streptacidiphilus sp. P02-A3a]|uniref:response regulator transcription factor n=1 Tax=Streptacidiphilus sp. P02-A3a TaxID=2704468 RepID=UPI0015FD0847|nr:response regulator [Streptacidiphilus sp. P02-A3a]QMU73039.1 response regulator transcription factor [Streptacidiphilus sp. P02-A3a]
MECLSSAPKALGSSDDPSAGNPVRVLLVDGDARVRSALRHLIALEGDLVVVADAGSVDGALVAAERTSPAVALVELLLPDAASGLALVRVLATRPDCAIVAMSLRGGLEEAAVGAGAVLFVDKGNGSVLDAVRTASRRHRDQDRDGDQDRDRDGDQGEGDRVI